MNIKEVVHKYEEIRQSGKYNMVMDAAKVISEIGCTRDQYFYVIKNYSSLISNV